MIVLLCNDGNVATVMLVTRPTRRIGMASFVFFFFFFVGFLLLMVRAFARFGMLQRCFTEGVRSASFMSHHCLFDHCHNAGPLLYILDDMRKKK